MAGLHILKHVKGLSDEAVCAAWVENPYFQAFCGERFFQHRLPVNGGAKVGHVAAQNQASGGAPSAMARALVT
jgi:hypothetical protein